MSKRKRILYIAIALALASVAYVTLVGFPVPDGKYDTFAQCLAEKDITMYGAAWCPHCQREKRLFGSSFQYVPYVECPDNPALCTAKDVKGYPTWIFPDGRVFAGEQGLEKLSRESACPLIPAGS
jgi:glutaredoxin